MSHELTTRADGRVEMAYAGRAPWHGLGATLPEGADIELWRAAAGMDWRILRSKVRYAPDAAHAADVSAWRVIEDRHVLLRSDNGNHLGIVSEDYKVVQPGAVLEFFRDLTAGAGFTLETAGTLFGGRRFWALARIGADAQIRDRHDRVGGYLLLCTSADGTMSTEARFTTVRVVCNNTLGFARASKAQVKVTHRTAFDAGSVKAALGVGPEIQDEFAATIEEFRRLAQSPVDRMRVVEATGELFAPGFAALSRKDQSVVLDTAPVKAVGALAINRRARGSALEGVSGTAWGWLNAVTEYVDHHARARSQDNRLNSAWFGKGDALKARAREIALAMADGTVRYQEVSEAAADSGSSDLTALLSKPARTLA